MTEQRKECTKCHQPLPMSAFARNRSNSDGHESQCRACRAEAMRRWREANKEHCNQYARDTRWRYRDRVNAYRRKVRSKETNRKRECRHATTYRARYPEKESAKRAVRNAVKAGILVRPNRCEACGAEVDAPLHGHHWRGYAAALDVVWLCVKCHTKAHRTPAPTEASGGGSSGEGGAGHE